MKKFEFSLQKVMEVRQTEEKVLQKRLADAQCELRTARDELDTLAGMLEQQLERKAEMQRCTINSARYMLVQNYIRNIEDYMEDTRQRITGLEAKVEEARLKLLEKAKEKKAIEKLRETRFEEYQRETRREEQDFLDEITAQNGKARAVR